MLLILFCLFTFLVGPRPLVARGRMIPSQCKTRQQAAICASVIVIVVGDPSHIILQSSVAHLGGLGRSATQLPKAA